MEKVKATKKKANGNYIGTHQRFHRLSYGTRQWCRRLSHAVTLRIFYDMEETEGGQRM